MARTQMRRELMFRCPSLKDNDLLLAKRFFALEKLGALFQFRVDLLSENPAITYTDLLGKPAVVSLLLKGKNFASAAEQDIRHFHGMITAFGRVGKVNELTLYRAELEPTMGRFSRMRDCRIFQDASVPNIVIQTNRLRGMPNIDDRLLGKYPEREFCVQYRETTLDFLQRLMEEEGIYYFFTHAEDMHTLVLIDSKEEHEKIADYESLPFRRDGVDHISQWQLVQTMSSSLYRHRDFDFTRPMSMARLDANSPAVVEQPFDRLDVYEYPGDFGDGSDDPETNTNEELDRGLELARIRMEELQTDVFLAEGVTQTARGLAVGHKFTLTDHPTPDLCGDYLISETRIVAEADDYQSEDAPYHVMKFQMNLKAHRLTDNTKWQYRMPRVTPKPVIPGLQSAIVVGPQGQEIWTDKWGRVRVRFIWDRRADTGQDEPDEGEDSCWLRVAQTWAGPGFGALFLPRVDQEVLVGFLEGNPDRPIVVGSLYNATSNPPIDLPRDRTRSTLRSASVPATSGGYNELRFEDLGGEEQVYIHGQRYTDRIVEDESCDDVIGKRNEVTQGDRLERNEADRHHIVAGDRRDKIAGAFATEVLGDQKDKIDGDRHVTVGGDRKDAITADHHDGVGNDRMTSVGNDEHTVVGNSQIVQVGSGGRFVTVTGPDATFVSGSKFSQVAAQHYQVAGQVVIEATGGVCIKNGGSTVVVDPSGVTVAGPIVKINPAAAVPLVGAPVPPQSPTSPDAAETGDEAWPAKNAADDHITGPALLLEHQGRILKNGATLKFGDIDVGEGGLWTLKAFNVGTGSLSVSKIEVAPAGDPGGGEDDYATSETSLSVSEGESGEFDVTFEPCTLGGRNAVLRLTHDGSDEPLEIALEGAGVGPVLEIKTPGGTVIDPEDGPYFCGNPPAHSDWSFLRKSLEIWNTGKRPLIIDGMSITGKNPDCFRMTLGMVGQIAPGESWTLPFEVYAHNDGLLEAELLLESNAVNGEAIKLGLQVRGTVLVLLGKEGPALETNEFLDLPDTNVGAKKSLKVMVKNLDSTAFDTKAKIVGPDSADGQIDVRPASFKLDPNGEQELEIDFRPGTKGGYEAELFVDAGGGRELHAPLRGKALAPVMKLMLGDCADELGSDVEIGPFAAGEERNVTFTVENEGDAKLTLTQFECACETGIEHYTKQPLEVKVSPDTVDVEPGESGSFEITLKSPRAAEFTGKLSFATNDPVAGNPDYKLSGETVSLKIKEGARLLGDGDEVFVGAAPLGTNLRWDLTLINPTGYPLEIEAGPFSGPAGGDFMVSPKKATLPRDEKKPLAIGFKTPKPGERKGVLKIKPGKDAAPYMLNIVGAGTGLCVKKDDKALKRLDEIDCGGAPVEDASKPIDLVIENTSDKGVTGSILVRNEGAAEEFFADPAEFMIAPGDAMKVRVRAVPAETGVRRGYLELSTSDLGEGRTFDLILKATGT